MKVNLTLKMGENIVTYELNNVQELEYINLMAKIYCSDPPEETDAFDFDFDGGLSTLTFQPYQVQAVYATRSQP